MSGLFAILYPFTYFVTNKTVAVVKSFFSTGPQKKCAEMDYQL